MDRDLERPDPRKLQASVRNVSEQEIHRPHARLFAHLTAWGEVAVGVFLTLGLFTGLGSLIGLVLVLAYGLAVQWMSPTQQGFHIILFALMLAFFFARAGRRWGCDASLARSRPKSFLTRRPIA